MLLKPGKQHLYGKGVCSRENVIMGTTDLWFPIWAASYQTGDVQSAQEPP